MNRIRYYGHDHDGPCPADDPHGIGNTVTINGAKKFDGDKARLDLLSPVALTEIAKVMGFGAKKYAAHNWRKGIVFSRLLAALLRHVFAYLGGESKDPESGLSHLAHAGCCIMFLLEFEATRPDLDDRYKPSSDASMNNTPSEPAS